MNIFNSLQSIGEIVSMMPDASKIFKQYNIDFCCGGDRQLSTAIKEQNLNEAEILSKLDEVYDEAKAVNSTNKDFRTISLTELMNHIENIHHVYMKDVLPEISELTTKILRVHGSKHEELLKVHKLFHTLKTDIEQHLFKEEEILFPLIREYEGNPSAELLERVITVIGDTENEHELAGNILKELRRVTGQYNVPKDGCGTYTLTFRKLQEMEADLFQHIHLENNILFKRIGY